MIQTDGMEVSSCDLQIAACSLLPVTWTVPWL